VDKPEGELVRRATRAGAVPLLLALLVIAGCGGGSSDSASTTTITKQQWARKAYAICAHLSHKQQHQGYAFKRAHGMKVSPGQHEQERINTVWVMPFVERKIDALRALPVPEGEQAKIDQILKSMEEGIRVSKAHPAWLAAPTSAHPVPFSDTTELTAAYGIWICGQA
jgi:hypothetical protein